MLRDFLLTTDVARNLFHDIAESLPVIDYHNHLDVKAMASNLRPENITQLWLANDPYKHRAMRINGIPEELITGSAEDKDKFRAWAQTISKTLGGPLFDWSRIELQKFFGIESTLCEGNYESIWNECNAIINADGFNTTNILESCNVELICPCADICDDLSLFNSNAPLRMTPSLRGDSIIAFEDSNFAQFLAKLADATDCKIDSLEKYKAALKSRFDDFAAAGCCLSDHSLDDGFEFVFECENNPEELFLKSINDDVMIKEQLLFLQTHILTFVGKCYHDMEWAMQLHMGALRYTSSRLRSLCGPAGGFAGIGNPPSATSLSMFLDRLESEGYLPRTILFTLNPTFNEQLAILTGSFAEDGVSGKVQFGPAWWWNDNRYGIENHLEVLANYSLLGTFVGMTTDSRSPLSFSRHEYFRRILCNTIADWAQKGMIPSDYGFMEELITGICYMNAKQYFKGCD